MRIRLRHYLLQLVIIFFAFSSICTQAQDKYWVFFKDKAAGDFNPFTYFDKKAIDRREKLNLPLYNEKDLPVREDYLVSVKNITGNIGKVSRWFNAVSVSAEKKRLELLKKLDCVHDIQPVQTHSCLTYKPVTTKKISTKNLSDQELKLLRDQIAIFNAHVFDSLEIDGSGIRIAVFDGGFPGVDKNPVFEHLHNENKIIKTYDFVKDREFVYNNMSHGTKVLSCIAGMLDEQKMGLATGAEFLLARTEVKIESFAEEENWLAAVEWADKNGADIINSSLGYTYHRYFSKDMDGKTTLVSRAANIAAKRGMLVINAMGNDGNSYWEVLGAPADADSVLSVGGINPDTRYHIYFSSFGPTADKRLKPNLSAFGKAIVAGKRKIKTSYGTSFATPLITGFAACAWQLNPSLTNMELFRKLQKSGSLYPYFDYAHGYGIPKADYFVTPEQHIQASFRFDIEKNFIHVTLLHDPDDGNKNYVFYHIKGPDGVLKKYAVVIPNQKKVVSLPLDDIRGNSITVHYKGYTKEYKL